MNKILVVIVLTFFAGTFFGEKRPIKELTECEANLELLSEVYCQQLKILKYSGSKNKLVIEMITEEEENPVCNY